MEKKQITLVVVALVLIGLFLYIHNDWFSRDKIQIYHRLAPTRALPRRAKPADASDAASIFFGFDRKLKLTSIKVIPLSEFEKNKYSHPVWEMISDSNSVPTKGFVYGMNVPGMKLALKDITAEPLTPGVKYRLIVETGDLKAQHDFTPAPQKN